MTQFNENDTFVKNKGKITCDRKILLSIINLATKEIAGISSMSCPIKYRFKEFFTRNTKDGVAVKFKENGTLLIDVHIRIIYGYKVPEVAYKVQENIKNGIAAMVDMQTAKINVHILGVDFEKDEASDIA